MAFFSISVGTVGSQLASLYGSDKSNLTLASTHRFSGAIMPALRAARANGELSRAQYKRAKDLIEKRMQENMQYDQDRSFPYGTVTKADVRAEIRSLLLATGTTPNSAPRSRFTGFAGLDA
jgi:hypothetical protein